MTTVYIDADGIWSQPLRGAYPTPRPALFLDRDGVINVEVDYLHRAEDCQLEDGAGATIRRANELGIAVVVVTNQSGVGRGYFDWQAFDTVQQELMRQLAKEGAELDAVYACPFHEKAEPPFNVADHPARKPAPGMLFRAMADLNLEASQSWIVGDKAGDLGAGRNAGLAGGLHVLTGHGKKASEQEKSKALAREDFEVLQASSIRDAVALPLFSAAGGV
ncbi:MAG: D-glycero-alpha-D-manno-heptose-1,7-bisphosphate 7-phosphatase [Magnetovibrionaceae bacterium]